MTQNLKFHIDNPLKDPYVLHSLFDEYISDNIGNQREIALQKFSQICADCVIEVPEFKQTDFSLFLETNFKLNEAIANNIASLSVAIENETLENNINSNIIRAIENNHDSLHDYDLYSDFVQKYTFKNDETLVPFIIRCISEETTKSLIGKSFFLCSGYWDVTRKSGHLVGIYYSKDYIVITNSGEGIQNQETYIKKSKIPENKFPVIIIFKNNTTDEEKTIEALINLTITMSITYPKYSPKRTYTSFIDEFYYLLNGIIGVTEIVETPEIFHLPQLSGSCTFFGIYYFIYYYLVIKQNDKKSFNIFDTYLKFRCIQSIYEYIPTVLTTYDSQIINFLEITNIKYNIIADVLKNGLLPQILIDHIKEEQVKFDGAVEKYIINYEHYISDYPISSKSIFIVNDNKKQAEEEKLFTINDKTNSNEGTFIVLAAKKVETSSDIITYVNNLSSLVKNPFNRAKNTELKGMHLCIVIDVVYKLLIQVTNKDDDFFISKSLKSKSQNLTYMYPISAFLLEIRRILFANIKEERINTQSYVKIITALLLYIFFKTNDVIDEKILKKFVNTDFSYSSEFNKMLLMIKLPYYSSKLKRKEDSLNMYNLSMILQKYQYYFIYSTDYYYLWTSEYNYTKTKPSNKGEYGYNSFYEMIQDKSDERYQICRNITSLMVSLYDTYFTDIKDDYKKYFVVKDVEEISPYYRLLVPTAEKFTSTVEKLNNIQYVACNYFIAYIFIAVPKDKTTETLIKFYIKTPKSYSKDDTNIFMVDGYNYRNLLKLENLAPDTEYVITFIIPFTVHYQNYFHRIEFISSNSLNFMTADGISDGKDTYIILNKLDRGNIHNLIYSTKNVKSSKDYNVNDVQYATTFIDSSIVITNSQTENMIDLFKYISKMDASLSIPVYSAASYDLSLGWSMTPSSIPNNEQILITASSINIVSKFNYKSNDYAEIMVSSLISFIESELDTIVENLSFLKNNNSDNNGLAKLTVIIYTLKYINYDMPVRLKDKLLTILNYFIQLPGNEKDNYIVIFKNLVEDVVSINDLISIFSPEWKDSEIITSLLSINNITKSYDLLESTLNNLSAIEYNKVLELPNTFDLKTITFSDSSLYPFLFSVKNKVSGKLCHIIDLTSINNFSHYLRNYYIFYIENDQKIDITKVHNYKSAYVPSSPYKNNIFGTINFTNKQLSIESKFGTLLRVAYNIEFANNVILVDENRFVWSASNIYTLEYYQLSNNTNNQMLVITYDTTDGYFTISINSTVYEIVTYSYNPIITRWISGNVDCLLLRKKQGDSLLIDHKILFLTHSQTFYKSAVDLLITSSWNKVTDLKIIKDLEETIYKNIKPNKYYLLDLHYTGLFCNSSDFVAMSIFYFHNVLLGKHSILYALNQQLINLLENSSENGILTLYIYKLFNNPFNHYFSNKQLAKENEAFTRRKHAYPVLYQTVSQNSFPNNDVKYKLENKIFTKNRSSFITFFNYFINSKTRKESSNISKLDINNNSKLNLQSFYIQNKVCSIQNEDIIKSAMNELYDVIVDYNILDALYTDLYRNFTAFNYASYHDFIIDNYNLLYEILNFKIALEVVIRLRELCKVNLCDSCNEISEILKQFVSDEIYTGDRDAKLLMFETTFGNLVRNDQLKLTNNIIDSIKTNNYYVYQLLMGRGKTTVVTPLLVYEFLFNSVYDKTNHIILILPNHLIKQSMNNFIGVHGFSLEYLRLQNLEFSASSNEFHNHTISNMLNSSHKNLLIIDDTSFKALKLNLLTSNIKDSAKLLNKIRDNSITVIDEIDSIYNPLTSDLNYPSKATFKIDFQNVAEKFIIGTITLLFKRFYSEIISKNNVIDSKKFLDSFISSTPLIAISSSLAFGFQKEYDYFVSFYVTNTKNVSAINLNLTVIYLFKFIYMCLIHALILIYKKDYGFGIKNSIYSDKNFYTAIPFFAVDTPANGTEFTDIITSIILTTLSYFHYWKANNMLRILDISFVMSQVKMIYNALGETIALSYFKNLNNMLIMINKDKTITYYVKNNSDDVLNEFNLSLKSEVAFGIFIQYYLIDVIFNKFMNISAEQFNISFMDVISSTSIVKKTGFSGTINLILPSTNEVKNNFDPEIKTDIVADTTIQCVMLGCILPSQVIKLDKTSTSTDILNYVIKNEYNVLIDAGAYFRNETSNEIAKTVYTKFKGTRKIIFIDNTNTVMYYDGITFIKVEGNMFIAKESFYYYDHRHIVGTDIKQPPILSGITTINYFNKLTDTSQAIFRMRNTNNGHSNDYIYIDTFPVTIKDNKDTAGLYKFLEKNENVYMDGYKQKYLLQNIKLLRREQVIKKNPFIDGADISGEIKKEYTEKLYYISKESFKTAKDLDIDHQKEYINQTICKLPSFISREGSTLSSMTVAPLVGSKAINSIRGGGTALNKYSGKMITPDMLYKKELLRNVDIDAFNSLSNSGIWNLILAQSRNVTDVAVPKITRKIVPVIYQPTKVSVTSLVIPITDIVSGYITNNSKIKEKVSAVKLITIPIKTEKPIVNKNFIFKDMPVVPKLKGRIYPSPKKTAFSYSITKMKPVETATIFGNETNPKIKGTITPVATTSFTVSTTSPVPSNVSFIVTEQPTKIGNTIVPIIDNKGNIIHTLCSLIKSDLSVVIDNKSIQQEQQQKQQLELSLNQSQISTIRETVKLHNSDALLIDYLKMDIVMNDDFADARDMLGQLNELYGINMSILFFNNLLSESDNNRSSTFSIEINNDIFLATTNEMFAMFGYYVDNKIKNVIIRDIDGRNWYVPRGDPLGYVPYKKDPGDVKKTSVNLIILFMMGKRLDISEKVSLLEIMLEHYDFWNTYFRTFNETLGRSQDKIVYNSSIEKLFYDAYVILKSSGDSPRKFVKTAFIQKNPSIPAYFGLSNLDDKISAAIVRTL